jgi:TolA-binding protein/ferric-dicitrate binding protein FerR (iron transport regulator)
MPRRPRDATVAPTRALVDLVHAQRGRMSSRQRVEGAHFLVARWTWGRRRARRAQTWAAAAAAMLLAVAGAGAWTLHRKSGPSIPLACAVDGGRLRAGGVVEADPRTAPTLRFSDGTEVALGRDARSTVRALDDHGAHVSLAAGSAHVDVVHRDGARWLFDAGPFVIRVTGTAFTLSWEPATERLDVEMERGTVQIDGPLLVGSIPLHFGQHLTVRVRERETVVRDAAEPRVAESLSAGLPLEAPAPTAPTAPEATVPGATNGASSPRRASTRDPSTQPPESAPATPSVGRASACLDRRWASAVARDEGEAVVAEAQRLGLDECLAEASTSDLVALADAARYGRHPDVARRALASLRKRFAGSTAARDAAFLLGRLEEAAGDVARASEWYSLYMSESPSGTYASEALGRRMTLAAARDGAEQARSIARDYLRRFPGGAYAERARALARDP